MSAIRPDLPATATPQTAPSAVRSAQAAFFRAALTQAQSSEPPRAPPLAPPTTMSPTVTRTQASVSEPERMARPGSLLDIRV